MWGRKEPEMSITVATGFWEGMNGNYCCYFNYLWYFYYDHNYSPILRNQVANTGQPPRRTYFQTATSHVTNECKRQEEILRRWSIEQRVQNQTWSRIFPHFLLRAFTVSTLRDFRIAMNQSWWCPPFFPFLNESMYCLFMGPVLYIRFAWGKWVKDKGRPFWSKT